MNGSGKTLAQALQDWSRWLPTEQPLLITTLDEGLSHQSYLIASGGREYVLRINNPQSQMLALGLPREEKILRLMQSKNLGAKVIHFCCDYLVTEYVTAEAWMLEFSSDEELSQLATHLKLIHAQEYEDDFDLVRHCHNYWRDVKNPTPEQHTLHNLCFDLLITTLEKYPQRCLCHNDFSGENVLKTATGFITLDWEYASSNHPYFDLATLTELGCLDAQQQLSLLTHYWGESTPERLTELKPFKIIVCYVQWLWLLLQPSLSTATCTSEARLSQYVSTYLSE